MKQNACGICKENPSKYKCPTCLTPFCSVPCNRVHKQAGCTRAPVSAPSLASSIKCNGHEDTPEEDLLSVDQLHRLDTHEEVTRKVRDERVMAVLARIDGAPDRAAALRAEMADPAFAELCDDILEALGMGGDSEEVRGDASEFC